MSTTNLHVLEPARPLTAAERGMQEQFAMHSASLPGAGWVSGLRSEAIRAFAANGLPTRRIEAFKYTDLRERLKETFRPASATEVAAAVDADAVEAALGPLAAIDAYRLVFVDGAFRSDLSRSHGLAAAAEFMPLAPLLAKAPAWLEGKFAAARFGQVTALTSLNTAFMSDGMMLKVKPGQCPEKPVLLLAIGCAKEARSIASRHIIAVEAAAKLTLIEVHVALADAATAGQTNTLTDVTVADGGALTHIKCALGGSATQHLSNWVAKVGAAATYRGFQFTAGPGLARNDIEVVMAGEGSKLDLSGASLGRATSHIDTTLVVDHKVPGCESRELFKCVLDDRARGVFQGKIIVRPGADKTDGKQMARALMLSEDAEFDTKPELEIYADDVVCGHGATATELDTDLLFYCTSRGIPEAEARGLLIEAFIGEAVEKVEDGAIRGALMELARAWLAARAG